MTACLSHVDEEFILLQPGVQADPPRRPASIHQSSCSVLSRQRYIVLTSSRLLDFLPHLDKRTCIILVPLAPLTGSWHLIGDAEDIHANIDSIGVDALAEGVALQYRRRHVPLEPGGDTAIQIAGEATVGLTVGFEDIVDTVCSQFPDLLLSVARYTGPRYGQIVEGIELLAREEVVVVGGVPALLAVQAPSASSSPDIRSSRT